jgi:NAD+ diphosphatase
MMAAQMPYRIAFTGNDLDRAEEHRSRPEWLATRRSAENSRFLPFSRLRPLMAEGGETALGWLSPADIHRLGLARTGEGAVFLGLDGDGRAHFALSLDQEGPAIEESLSAHGRFTELRQVASLLSAREGGIAAQARSILDWRARCRFCSACGHALAGAGAGPGRLCGNEACRIEHFPRLDVVVITLVTAVDRCLLGRQARFAPGLFSSFAGFAEPGETAEGAARREVREEAGVELASISYAFSQPWPFPSALTLAFEGVVAGQGEDAHPGSEIVEVRWFSRAEVASMVTRAEAGVPTELPRLPAPSTLGFQLAKRWVESSP